MTHFQKHFTVAEANDLLPELEPLLTEIRAERDRLAEAWPGAVAAIRRSMTNGGGSGASDVAAGLGRVTHLLRRLEELGVVLKDVDRGLVDFPHLRGEQEVFLCWELGEDAVRYWHDLESGFPGRKPL